MKKLVLYIALVLLSFSIMAQQKGQYSQYQNNPYIINPAFTGIYDYLDLNVSYRRQWNGFKDAPQTYYVSAHKTLNKRPKNYRMSSMRISMPDQFDNLFHEARRKVVHSLGGTIMSEQFGPFRKTLGAISYAAHFPLSKDYNLGLGMSFQSYKLLFDRNMVDLEIEIDLTVDGFDSKYNSRTIQDANFGFVIYSKKLYFAYTADQILQNSLISIDKELTPTTTIINTLFAGYRFKLNKKINFIPSLLARYSINSPYTFNANVKFEVAKRFWFGLSYRDEDSVIGLFGLVINDVFKVSYSYDYTLSDLNKYNSGSHEIILGFKVF